MPSLSFSKIFEYAKSLYHTYPEIQTSPLYIVHVLPFARRGWSGGAKVSCILCHPGRPADIGLQLGKARYPCSR